MKNPHPWKLGGYDYDDGDNDYNDVDDGIGVVRLVAAALVTMVAWALVVILLMSQGVEELIMTRR